MYADLSWRLAEDKQIKLRRAAQHWSPKTRGYRSDPTNLADRISLSVGQRDDH